MAKEDIERLERAINKTGGSVDSLVKLLSKGPAAAAALSPTVGATESPAAPASGTADYEQIYNYIKGRLQDEAPKLINVAAVTPELIVTEEVQTINASTTGQGALMGRLALMIADGFFDEAKSDEQVRDQLKRYGLVAQKTFANVNLSKNMSNLIKWNFLFVENGDFIANPRMKKHIKKA